MSQINLSEENIDPRLQDIFQELEGSLWQSPQSVSYQRFVSTVAGSQLGQGQGSHEKGNLRRELKEAIALLVSKDNGCDYCVAAHEKSLRAVGVTAEEIRKIQTDLEKSMFNAKEQALIQLARQANRAPLQMTAELFRVLRSHGTMEVEIVEALAVMEIFTAFNKFLDALQVDNDFPTPIQE